MLETPPLAEESSADAPPGRLIATHQAARHDQHFHRCKPLAWPPNITFAGLAVITLAGEMARLTTSVPWRGTIHARFLTGRASYPGANSSAACATNAETINAILRMTNGSRHQHLRPI